MAKHTLVLTTLVLGSLAGCHGERSPSGLTEPIRIREAVFKSGALPGTPPQSGNAGAPGSRAEITAIETSGGVVTSRQSGKSLGGRASTDTFSVAIQFAGVGTGYWIVPVGGPDPTAGGELIWQATADFGPEIPVGIRSIRLVAIDKNGVAGTQRDVPVCVAPEVPDNLNACDPRLAPPDTVISLSWDTDVDLDLVIRRPDGLVLDWEHPSTASANGGSIDRVVLAAPNTGLFDRNSNADCVIDGIRQENVVWREAPAAGLYRVYVNLFSACGHPSVRFRVTVYRRKPSADGQTSQLVETSHQDGQLLGLAANGGKSMGLFVLEIPLP